MTMLDLIRDEIQHAHPIPLADYMEMVLSHPEYGYYQTRQPFGATGDFITAPEISQMFGELIGLWCVDYWIKLGSPQNFNLVELGPGSGRLMQDALRATRSLPEFLSSANICLVENSLNLRKTQRDNLGAHNITWHENIEDVPGGPMILIANEFFDALPVQQFIKGENGWLKRHVGLDGHNNLEFVDLDCSTNMLPDFCGAHDKADIGEIVEINQTSEHIVDGISNRIMTDGGAALIIDYGPATSAIGDSLQAVRDQKYSDPLDIPGAADITAHVDFEQLSKAASDCGCRVQGPTSQGRFLERLGIEPRAAILQSKASDDQKREIAGAFKRLVSSEEMGTLFKAIALTKKSSPLTEGFEATND